MVAMDSASTTWSISIVYLTLGVLILSATCGRIATVGIDLAVDRDWCVVKRLLKRSARLKETAAASIHDRILVISQSNSANLTTFNTSLRRTSLTCKLLAPLVVSFLTTASAVQYQTCVWILLSLSIVTAGVELWWLRVFWHMFPVLEQDEARRREATDDMVTTPDRSDRGWNNVEGLVQNLSRAWVETAEDWVEFGRMPVFLSELQDLTWHLYGGR
jgi:iron-regulated transporter 1